MNYELAKKLKEAGFSFHHPDSKWSEYIFPTLSELIEACGDNFKDLVRVSTFDEIQWGATSWFFQPKIETFGKTSEEAVAKLWLLLKKKSLK